EDLETDGGRAAVEDDAGEAPDRDAEGGSALRDVEGFGQPGARAAGIRGEAANEGPVAAVIADRRAGRRGAVRARRRRADRDRRGRPVQRECSSPDRPTRRRARAAEVQAGACGRQHGRGRGRRRRDVARRGPVLPARPDELLSARPPAVGRGNAVVDRGTAGAAASVRLARLCDREDTRYYEEAEGQRPSHRVLLRLGDAVAYRLAGCQGKKRIPRHCDRQTRKPGPIWPLGGQGVPLREGTAPRPFGALGGRVRYEARLAHSVAILGHAAKLDRRLQIVKYGSTSKGRI